MTKQELKEFLNNKENWKMFEDLVNDKELKHMNKADLWNADLENADLWKVDLSNAYLDHADFGDYKLVKKESE